MGPKQGRDSIEQEHEHKHQEQGPKQDFIDLFTSRHWFPPLEREYPWVLVIPNVRVASLRPRGKVMTNSTNKDSIPDEGIIVKQQFIKKYQ